ncbi:MAG TPA: helix-turn-helix transcriptional regulator [Terriglobales bacterium]|nr:helix-turn-helix transcriptional regulator [Terriglobales bacterium]
MEPGKWIRALREERMIKPSDVERLTRTVADTKRNADFYISHSTLADIEAGSIPSIHKLFSLATCLRVPLPELLLPFGINLEESRPHPEEAASEALALHRAPGVEPGFRFQLNFDTNFSTEETTLLRLRPPHCLENLPGFFQARIDPVRYRYAVIGSKDDGMADLLPPRSLVEIDTAQNTVQVFAWQTMRERPFYLVWHGGGHICRWCQVDGRDLTLLPHPLSRQPVRRFKMPGEATVVGRVTNAWLPFESAQFQREAAS